MVIGGGAIGCEFASMMADLGVQVTLLEALPKLLPGCDDDVAQVVVAPSRNGASPSAPASPSTVTSRASRARPSASATGEVVVDAVIVSVGRRPLSDGLVADGAGVEVDERGFVVVDEWMRTSADGVFGVGDVVGTPQLAHVGFAEAILVIKQILGEPASR